MSKNPLAIIILAAGKGTRMKSPKPKVMHELAGKPMINWLLDTATALNPEKIIVVAGPDMPELESAVAPHATVIQEQQNGTGDAIKPALPLLEGFAGQVLILMGDEPLIPLETLQDLANREGLSALAFNTNTPAGLGRVLQNPDGTLQSIIEDKDCTPEQTQITLCNAATYSVPASNLAKWINQISDDNAQGEYYLTDLPRIAANDGAPTQIIAIEWQGSWGINTRTQLAAHEQMLQTRLREALMDSGVTMQDPATVYLWHDTKIASPCTLEPNIYCGPAVTIEKNTTIKAFTHLEGTHIKSGASIGPFARLRPGAKIAQDVRIGNFVEIKNAQIGERSKIGHLAYVGDACLDEDVNFSAGAITVNYDGFQKHQTIIGKNVMIGSNVNLVAPIQVGDDAFVAAGSTITEDVPSGALSIAREPSEIRKGWAAKYRKIKQAAKDKLAG